MVIRAIRTKLIKPGDDLIGVIKASIGEMREGCVLAVTSKVVSLWEGRFVPRSKGVTLEKLVRQEARDRYRGERGNGGRVYRGRIWRSKHCWLALKQGILIPNAGVDESNAFDGFVLWPKDAYGAARRIHNALIRYYRLKRLGVLITDSWTMPLRHGVVGIALGYYGFAGQKNYIGKKDLHGRVMRITKVSAADTLASAAVLVMGEGSERTPLALIEDAPVKFARRIERGRLRIDPKEDVYREVLKLL